MSTPQFDFEDVFDADYLFFYETLLAGVTDADVDAIWRLLELEPDIEVLDLACGHGRIANRLAERGARVTGLDATPLFIERARRRRRAWRARRLHAGRHARAAVEARALRSGLELVHVVRVLR